MAQATYDDNNSGTTFEERLYLYTLTKLIAANSAIEIGSRQGHSGVWIARALSESGIRFLHCIDPFDGTHGSEGSSDEEVLHDRFDRCQLQNYVVHKGYSDRILDKFPDASVDFIFVDGDHSEEGLMSDFQDSLRIVRDGGMAVVHDAISIHTVHNMCIKTSEQYGNIHWFPTGLGMIAYQKWENPGEILYRTSAAFSPMDMLSSMSLYGGMR